MVVYFLVVVVVVVVQVANHHVVAILLGIPGSTGDLVVESTVFAKVIFSRERVEVVEDFLAACVRA